MLNSGEKELAFENRASWREWLSMNATSEREIWLIFFKKHSGVPSVTRQEALEEALCFGWIDSLMKSIDYDRYKQKYTPRKKNSRWSERNKMLVKQLLAEGKMEQPGLAVIAGWINEAPEKRHLRASSQMHPALVSALLKNIKASETFYMLPPSQQKNIIRWVNSCKKAVTLTRRVSDVISTLESGHSIGLK